MRVWDAKTQSLSPEWLAHSKLAKDLTLGDVLLFSCGPAKITGLKWMDGWIKIDFCYLHNDDEDGGRGEFCSNPEGRFMVDPSYK